MYTRYHVKNIDSIVYAKKIVHIGGSNVTLDVADTDKLRERGLSYRKMIDQNTGMLFVFERSGIYKFWMKDMNIPIDIVWLDSNKKIVHIEHSLSPDTYPQAFGPDINTQWVIELPAGAVKQEDVSVGDILSF